MRIGTRFARLIREGPRRVNATLLAYVTKPHKAVRPVRSGPGLVYIARMPGALSTTDRPRSPIRRLVPLIAVVLLAIAAYFIFGRGGISLEALVRHRMTIDDFVTAHRLLAVLAYIALYIAAVALSLP